MIATKKPKLDTTHVDNTRVDTTHVDMESAGKSADQYISTAFDSTYFTYGGEKREGGYHFMVKCLRDDMKRDPAVGSIFVYDSGDVQTLSEDRIRDMKEAAETQAAMHRKEQARDEDGHVLRYHARIHASCWLYDNVGLKIGASNAIHSLYG